MNAPQPSIPVTRPFLPPLDEYVELLRGIWDRRTLTNGGPLVQELEASLTSLLDLPHPLYAVANGGLGLQIILRALGVRGEVITTPFSYVATASCPLWEGCTLRFADIDPVYLTLDPAAVEAAITPRTEAILATHVYGNPCDLEGLEQVARRHGLALIYDAAHAFGVTWQGRGILNFGDASMVSLHATKLFHTVEGGLVTARDPQVRSRIEWMRRFGHDGTEAYHGVGINAKMSELHAAMGLAILPYREEIAKRRRRIVEAYDLALAPLAEDLNPVPWRTGASRNYAYMPVLAASERRLEALIDESQTANIQPRRYFFPSLERVPCLNSAGDVPIANSAAGRVLCLPLSADLTDTEVNLVISGLQRFGGKCA